MTRAAIIARRRRLKRKYQKLYDDVAHVLYQHDPMHIAAATDEYEPEVERILPGLAGCTSADDVLKLVQRVFSEMFWPEAAEPRERHEAIAKDIWRVAKENAEVSA